MSGKQGQSQPKIELPDRIEIKNRRAFVTNFKETPNYLTSKANEHLNSKKKNKQERQAEIEEGQKWNNFSREYKSAIEFMSRDLTSDSLTNEAMQEYKQNIMSFYQFLVYNHKNKVYGEFCQNMIDKLIVMFGKGKNEIPENQKHKKNVEALVIQQAQKPVFVQNNNNNSNRRNKYAHLSKKNKNTKVFSNEPAKKEAQKVEIPKFNIDIDGDEIPKENNDQVIKEEVSNMLETIGNNAVDTINQLEEKQEEMLLDDEIPHKVLTQVDLKEEDNVLINEEPVQNTLPLLGNENQESVKVPSLNQKPKGKKKKVIIIEIVSCSECDEDEDIKQFMGIEN